MAGRTKHATYQERYRHKLSEINKTNAEFMAYAEKKDPSFVAGFFAEKNPVILTFFFTTFLATYIKLNFFHFFPNLIQKQQQQRRQQQQQRQQANTDEFNLCVFLYENQVRKIRKRKHSAFFAILLGIIISANKCFILLARTCKQRPFVVRE